MERVAQGEAEGGGLAPVGAWLGPWEVQSPLGRGGFAEVVRARRQDGVQAALKVSRDPERVRPDPALGLHPHIVATLEAALDHDPPWVALELAAGGSLRGALGAARPAPSVALRLVAEVAAALDHAHGRGVLHLDLKPENVLLDGPLPAGRVRLADFGAVRPEPRVAHSLLGASQAGGAARTREYAAPELLEGGAVDRRADVFGLGALAFELLTGRRPVGLDRPTDLVPGLPRAVDEVLARALAADPTRRPGSAGALARELALALAPAASTPGAAVAPAPPPVAAPPPRRSGVLPPSLRDALAWLLLVASVAGLAALGVTAVARRRPAAAASRDGPSHGELAELLIGPGHLRATAVLPPVPPGPDAPADPAADEALRRQLIAELEALAAVVPDSLPAEPAGLHEPLQRAALIREAGAAQLIDPVRAADGGDPHLLLVDLAEWRATSATDARTPGLAELGRRVCGWVEARCEGHKRSLAVLPPRGAGGDLTSLHAELVAAVVDARSAFVVVRPRAGSAERIRRAGPEGLAARLLLVPTVDLRPVPGGAPTRLLRVALQDADTRELLGSATVELP